MPIGIIWLCPLSASTWWNFTDKEIKEKVDNSIEKPLFVLLYSHYCPHCVGLPEGFSRYNEGIGNRSDIFLSMIDCAVDRGCGYFHIRGTPTMYLVLGQKRRYWPISPERGPEGWNRWINERIGPNIRQIFNSSQEEAAKAEPSEGGTTFVLEVPSEDDKWVSILNETSKTFRIYNDTFVFKTNTSAINPSLRAYYSQHCYRQFSGKSSDIRSFVDENKFGVFHRYDKDELKDLTDSGQRAALLFIEDKLSTSQKAALREIPKGHCSDITYGWVSLKDNEGVLKMTEASSVDTPFLYSFGFNAGKSRLYKKRLFDIWSSEFIPHQPEVRISKGASMFTISVRTAATFGVIAVIVCTIIAFIPAFTQQKIN